MCTLYLVDAENFGCFCFAFQLLSYEPTTFIITSLRVIKLS